MLRRRDEGVGKIDFVDISSTSYNPAENSDLTYEQAGPPPISSPRLFWLQIPGLSVEFAGVGIPLRPRAV